jgi:hypothetical protein
MSTTQRMSTRRTLNPDQANHVRLPNSPSEANATMVNNTTKSTTSTKSPKKDNKVHYYIFHLNGTKGHVAVIGKVQAEKFKEEFEDSFKSPTCHFTSKANFEKELAKAKEADAKNKNTITSPSSTPTFASGSAMSPEARDILAEMSKNVKTDSFKADFYTHSRASQAVVTLRLTTRRMTTLGSGSPK